MSAAVDLSRLRDLGLGAVVLIGRQLRPVMRRQPGLY
jgi:hypothetical protein